MIPEGDVTRLELIIGRILRAGALVSTGLLSAGLVLSLSASGDAVAARLTSIGLIVLIATPVARVAASVFEYARQRDWLFVLLTSTVLAILLGSLLVALRG